MHTHTHTHTHTQKHFPLRNWKFKSRRGCVCIYIYTLSWWLSGKELAFQCRRCGFNLILGSGRSLGEENVNPLMYSCLGNPMDRGAWWAIVYSPRSTKRVRYGLATEK